MPDAPSRTTGRLHWTVVTGGATHRLDVMPRFRGRASITVDGRRLAVSPPPSPRRPWIETPVDLDGRRVTVAIGGIPPWLETDVFLDGVSLLDGRTLEDARAAAPAPISRFEAWTRGPVSGIATTRLAPPLVVAAALASFALMAIGLLVAGRGVPAAVLAGLGMLGWQVVVVVRTYLVGVAKVRAWLVTRDDLGDHTRFAVLMVAAAVGGFAALGLFFVPLLVLAAFRP